MKPRLNIRELPALDYFPPHGEVNPVSHQPFVLVNVRDSLSDGGHSLRKALVWLQHFSDDGLSGMRSGMMDCALYGKPISEDQTISRYTALPKVGKDSSRLWYKANMIGICEQLKYGNVFGGKKKDDSGEVYMVKSSFNGIDFYGVWADSYGAARKLCKEQYDANRSLWESDGLRQPSFESCIGETP